MSPRILFTIIITAIVCAADPAFVAFAGQTAQEKYLMSLQQSDSAQNEAEELDRQFEADAEAEIELDSEFESDSEFEPEAELENIEDSKPAASAVRPLKSPEEKSGSWVGRLFRRNKPDSVDLQDNYQKALRYYDRRQLDKAQKVFERIERQYPDYKETRRYLTVINQRLKHEQKMVTDENYRQEALTEEQKKEAWRLDMEDELDRQRKAEEAYKEGRILYDQTRFEAAKEKFELVSRISPRYRQTDAFLKSIERKMADAASVGQFTESVEERIVESPVVRTKPRKSSVKITEIALPDPVKETPVEVVEIPRDSIEETPVSMVEPAEDVVEEYQWEAVEPVVPVIERRSEEVTELPSIAIQTVKSREAVEPGWDSEARLGMIERIAEPIYVEALESFKYQNYEEAERKFLEVQMIDPEYKAVGMYLKKIEEARKEDEVRVLDEQARNFSRRLRDERLAEKVRADKEERIAKELRKAKRKEVESLYKQARKDYDRKEYVSAKEKFEQVVSIEPGYLSTERYLQKINEALFGEDVRSAMVSSSRRLNIPLSGESAFTSQETGVQAAVQRRRNQLSQAVQEKYDQAMMFYKDGNDREARYKFIEVEAMFPDYKETRSYLAKLEGSTGISARITKPATQGSVKTEKTEKRRVKSDQADTVAMDDAQAEQLYQQALTSFGQGDYLMAQEHFEALQNEHKGYKDSKAYLKRSRKMVKKQEDLHLKDIKDLARKNEGLSRIAHQEAEDFAQIESSAEQAEAPEKKSWMSKLFSAKKKDAPPSSSRITQDSTVEHAREGVVMGSVPQEQVQPVEDGAAGISQRQSEDELQYSDVDEEKTESFYQEGIVLYDQGNYLGAQERFEEIHAMSPKYKNTAEYLKKSRNMVSQKEKERLKGVRQLAKTSEGVQEQEQSQEEKKSLLGRMKFWGKSSAAKEEEVVAVTPKQEAEDEKSMARLKEDISTREAEDAERIAKLERRHRREKTKAEGLPEDIEPARKKSGGWMSKIFTREERDANLDRRRKDLEEMVAGQRKTLQDERSKIQKEFERSLDDLYVKAAQMDKAGLTQQAYKIFVEIDRLQPGYKDTQKYLARMTGRDVMQTPAVADAGSGASRDNLISSALDQFETGM